VAGSDLFGIHPEILLGPRHRTGAEAWRRLCAEAAGRQSQRARQGDRLDPPRKLSVTWQVEWPEEFRKLPECVVTYEIAKAGEAVRLTMSESHSWNVPEAILSGGRMGWPAILSSLKSLLETGKVLAIKMEPPREMVEEIKKL
jgi:uncharacterized protein YndB with AHSA1/START domain